MLKKPYLLVYQPASRRADTKFLPVVLDGDALYYYLSKLLRGANLYTPKGLPETASLRSIRAEIGRTLFASGKNANEVSSFLGNSPMVAQTHYDNYRPIDDAKMYDKLWQETIEKGIAAHTKQKLLPQTVMYGTCNSQKECPGKDCRKCPSLICKPYIRDHLSKYPEFSHTDKGDYKSPEEMAARIEVLEDRLSKSVNRNKELLAEIQKIRAESAIKYKQLQLDYERLAGAYQKETEKKIIRL